MVLFKRFDHFIGGKQFEDSFFLAKGLKFKKVSQIFYIIILILSIYLLKKKTNFLANININFA